jgi:hypothetical protein
LFLLLLLHLLVWSFVQFFFLLYLLFMHSTASGAYFTAGARKSG